MRSLRSIAAEAIRSSQSNALAKPDRAEKEVTISDLSFTVDQETEREVEAKRSEIRDVLGVGTEANASDN